MELAAMIVSGLAIFLFILSFFFKDRSKVNQQEIEDVSMDLYQELYQLKKRVKIVEEEIMVDTPLLTSHKIGTNVKPKSKKPVNEIILNQVLSLHKQGFSIDQIVTRSSLSKEDVNNIIKTRS
ncbi:hypothetical protein [Jeotgalibacillus marinus]|uniref:Resolvase HTH domain-containing protein n=1 Tax=Jeotgalibacillus marinus TaxID=86667 RepID=A0ABV3PZG1_9BACL